MNKILFIKIILISFLYIGIVYAQTPKWVSTEVQNRAVVLEYFTNMLYPISKIAHRAAHNLPIYNNINEEQFIFIAEHYGLSSSKYFDLTTDESFTIFENAGIHKDTIYSTDFGTGSINRSTVPWLMSYDKWEEAALNIKHQLSLVNVYVKPEINLASRELTVYVEYYYTDDSPASKNYLTVMLLQNEIIGYQRSGYQWNQYSSNDTSYHHMHVLRKVISDGGVWGDTIYNTKKGSYECRKYTITLPETIKNVPLDITNLEVVAFISENKGNIYTGHKAVIEVSKDIKTDLSIEDITEYNDNDDDYRFKTIHPKFKITNNSNVPVTKFDISCILVNSKSVINGNAINLISTTKIYDTIAAKIDTYSGRINQGESIIFEMPEFTQSDLKHGMFYTLQSSVSNIYNNDIFLVDTNKNNNSTAFSKIVLFDNAFSELKLSFETENGISYLPPHIVLDNSLNNYFAVVDTGGAKNTNASVLFLLRNFYNIAFKPGYILIGEINCHDNPNKILSYYYAFSYGYLNGTTPQIEVQISKDWGKTWQTISKIFCQETGKISDISEFYIPTSDEYKQVQIDLSEYVKENFILRIGGIPGTNGSTLWIDEISITNGSYEESIKEDNDLSVYPNPASNILYINSDNLLNEEYEIYDLSGKLIIKDINNTNTINVENLSTGTYSFIIKDNIYNFIKK